MSHRNDIHCGKAIVFYALPCIPTLNWPESMFSKIDITKLDSPEREYLTGVIMEGWILPGGQRTQSRDVAETVARNMAEALMLGGKF